MKGSQSFTPLTKILNLQMKASYQLYQHMLVERSPTGTKI